MTNEVKISGVIEYISKKGPYNDIVTVEATLYNRDTKDENAKKVKVNLNASFNYKKNKKLFEQLFCNTNVNDEVYVEGELTGSTYLSVRVKEIINTNELK